MTTTLNTKADNLSKLLKDKMGQKKIAPLSPIQQRFWLDNQINEQKEKYNVSVAVEIFGTLNIDTFKQAVHEVQKRHEALNLFFASVGKKTVQVAMPFQPKEITFVDLSGQYLDYNKKQELLNQYQSSGFDLNAKESPWKAFLFKLNERHFIGMLVMHHIISDGWSVSILHQEIFQAYYQLSSGQDLNLGPNGSFFEMVKKQRGMEKDPRVERQAEFWKDKLQGLPPLFEMPYDKLRPAHQSFKGDRVPLFFNSKMSAAIKETAKARGCTPFVLLLAYFKVLLNGLSGNKNTLIGVPVSGRHSDASLENVVGPALNTMLIRTDFEKEGSFVDFTNKVKLNTMEAFENQDVLFERVLEKLKVPRAFNYMPVCQIGYNYHHYPNQPNLIEGLNFKSIDVNPNRSIMDLSLIFSEEGEMLQGYFEYNTNLFLKDTIIDYSKYFMQLLEHTLENESATVKEMTDFVIDKIAPRHFTQHMLQLFRGELVSEDQQMFNNLVSYTLNQELDPELFIRAVNHASRNMDALKTMLRNNDGIPRTLYSQDISDMHQFIDYSNYENPDCALSQLMESIKKGYDNFQKRLYFSRLVKLEEKRYVWIMNHHHIFSDGAALMIKIQRMSDIYQALKEGKQESEIATNYAQLKDILAEDIQYQRSPRFVKDKKYWDERLSKIDSSLTFYGKPWDKKTTLVDRTPYNIGTERSSKLKEIFENSKGEKGLDAFLCKVFGVLLAVYVNKISAGVETICMGSVLHNRRSHAKKNAFGLCSQVAPHVLDVKNDITFKDLMKQMDIEMAKAQRHGQFSVENPMHKPYYDVLLNYHKELPVLFDDHKVQYDVYVERATQSLGLNITNYDLTGDLGLFFDFHRDIFDRERYPEYISHFMSVLDHFIANPDAKISEVSLLNQEEKQKILHDWNDTDKPFDLETDIFTQFSNQVKKTPDRIAIEDNTGVLTYSELLERIQKGSASLAQHNINKEVIPIIGDRSSDFLCAMLSIYGIGSAYLPIDPNYPEDRIQYILNTAKCKFVCCSKLYEEKLEEYLKDYPEIQILTLESLFEKNISLEEAKEIISSHEKKTSDLSYIIFTSGSTGKPKGVMVHQKGMINHLMCKIEDQNMTSEDVLIQNASQCFDISVWQFLSPLLVGGKVHVVDNATIMNPSDFISVVEDGDITLFEVVPSYLRVMLEYIQTQHNQPTFRNIRYVMVTGEALPPGLCNEWLDIYPDIPLINAYGPTECSDDVTHHFIDQPLPTTVNTVPIGKVISNTQLYVLDKNGHPLPPGIDGELHVGGDGVGYGYIGNEEQTQKAFIQNHINPDRSPLLYKTGDRVRYLENGLIDFKGRFDYQVKLRGFRIELSEIESVIQSSDLVKSTLVEVKEVQGNDAIVAYIVPETDNEELVRNLSDICTAKLAYYMVPQYWQVLEEFPLSDNGKIDRKKLPLPQSQKDQISQQSLTPEEQSLKDVWCHVLGAEDLDVNESFFDLGGTSLQIIQLITLCEEKDLYFKADDLLRNQSIASLAQVCKSKGEVKSAFAFKDTLPVTPGQKQFLESSHGNLHWDHVSFWIHAKDTQEPHIKKALHKIVDDNEVFSIRFIQKNEQWYQKYDSSLKSKVFDGNVPLKNLDACDEDIANEVHEKIHITDGPLACFKAFRISPNEYSILFVAHHLLFDAYSSRILYNQLEYLLDKKDPSSQKVSKNTPWNSWVQEVHSTNFQKEIQKDLDYWENKGPFREHATLSPWVEKIQSSNTVNNQERVLVSSDTPMNIPMQDAQHILLANWYYTLWNEWGQDHLSIGIVGSGRSIAPTSQNLSQIMGWFNTYYPIHLVADNPTSLTKVLQQLNTEVDQIRNDGLAYSMLQYTHAWNKPKLDDAVPSLMFNYLGQREDDTKHARLNVSTREIGINRHSTNQRMAYVHLECQFVENKLVVKIDFHKELQNKVYWKHIAESYQQNLNLYLGSEK